MSPVPDDVEELTITALRALLTLLQNLKCPHCKKTGNVTLRGFYPGARTVIGLNEPYGAVLRRFRCVGCLKAKIKSSGQKCISRDFSIMHDDVLSQFDACASPCHTTENTHTHAHTHTHPSVAGFAHTRAGRTAFRELLNFRVRKKICVDVALIDLINRLRIGGASFQLISNALANCQTTRHHRRHVCARVCVCVCYVSRPAQV